MNVPIFPVRTLFLLSTFVVCTVGDKVLVTFLNPAQSVDAVELFE